MSLFRVSTRGLIPFRLITDEMESQPDVTSALVEALWSDLNTVTGLTLMPVQRGGTATDDGDADVAPIVVALDSDGNIVVLYAAALLDSTGLALCLEHVGWARGVTVSELAGNYWRGSDEFWQDWQDFSGTTSPLSAAGPRAPALFIVTITMTDSAEAALGFLTDAGVPVRVLRAGIYADDHGCQLLELGGRSLPAPASAQLSTATRRRRDPGAEPESADPATEMVDNVPLNGHRDRRTTTAAPKTWEAVEGPRPQAPSRFVDTSSSVAVPGGDRQVRQERGVDVGSMNRAAADELFSGSQRQQSRFTRPTAHSPGSSVPQPGSVSPLRRRQLPTDDVIGAAQADDDLEQPYDESGLASFTRHGERRNHSPRPVPSPPHLAPLKFPGEPIEPVMPDELLGPIGRMTGNGAGNGRGSHSAG